MSLNQHPWRAVHERPAAVRGRGGHVAGHCRTAAEALGPRVAQGFHGIHSWPLKAAQHE